MSAERATTSGDGRDQGTVEPLYVVRVDDHIDGRLAGHDGCAYVSPPASRESALALVGLLLGSGPRPANGAAAWTLAVPGGRRTITLAPASNRTAEGGPADATGRMPVVADFSLHPSLSWPSRR